MTPQELNKRLDKLDLSNTDFADVIGVTFQAVDHWLEGRRRIPKTVIKLLDLFDRRPELVAEF